VSKLFYMFYYSRSKDLIESLSLEEIMKTVRLTSSMDFMINALENMEQI
jgi:hypothetical protein